MSLESEVPEVKASGHAVQKTAELLPLCCDLDGTLIFTDLLHESILALFKANLRAVFLIPFWLLKGKAHLKAELQKRVRLDVESLPYNQEVVAFLKAEKLKGRSLVLVTASNELLANEVAKHLGLFDLVFGSPSDKNLRGSSKASLLKDRFGAHGFDYIGDEVADLAVWKVSSSAIVVGRSNSSLIGKVKKRSSQTTVLPGRTAKLRDLIRAVRPHQAAKNVLIFIPMITSHRFTHLGDVVFGVLAFIAFTMCAWSGYLINDLLDLSSDRRHTQKRNRPLASGRVTVSTAVISAFTLIVLAAGIASQLPGRFAAVLAIYFAMTISYSVSLKSKVMLDVIFLACLYVIRVIAGHEAMNIPYSPWLLAFSMYIFLSLALLKRFAELRELSNRSLTSAHGRGYTVADASQVNILGAASGYMSVLVLAFYLNSPDVVKLYSKPQILWLLCPVILFWVSRVWILANRGEMHHDPIVFAIRDRTSLLVGTIAAFILFLASVL